MTLLKMKKILKSFLPGLVLILSLAVVFANITVALAGSFDKPEKAVEGILLNLVENLKKLINPLGIIAILVSVIMMFLPGQSAKNVEKLKAVIWAVVGAVILVNALDGILKLSSSLGQQIGSGLQ